MQMHEYYCFGTWLNGGLDGSGRVECEYLISIPRNWRLTSSGHFALWFENAFTSMIPCNYIIQAFWWHIPRITSPSFQLHRTKTEFLPSILMIFPFLAARAIPFICFTRYLQFYTFSGCLQTLNNEFYMECLPFCADLYLRFRGRLDTQSRR